MNLRKAGLDAPETRIDRSAAVMEVPKEGSVQDCGKRTGVADRG